MAGLEANTDSYNQPLPVGPLEMAQKIGNLKQQSQQIESGGLTIDKQKLDNANQGLTYLTRAMSSLGPDASKEQYKAVGANAVKMGLVPPNQLQTWYERVDAAPDSKTFYNELVTAAANHQEAIAHHLGTPGMVSNGQQDTPVLISPKFGIKRSGLPIQRQIPPDASVPTPDGTQALGPQEPVVAAGRLPVQDGIPGQSQPAPAQQPLPVGSIKGPIQGPSSNFGGTVTGATADAPTFAERYKPAGPMQSQSPMFEEGKKQLVEDQALATQKMTAVKPAILAMKLLPGLRSGPGTEPFQKAVAFLKANNLISTDKENDTTVVYQEANKYLSQYLKGRGGRSDADLEAAAKSSPNVGTQLNPALTNLTRSAIAQDRVEAARATAFEGKDYSKYGKHRATFPQSIDERAFSLDLMPKDESAKLVDQMHNKYKKNPNSPEALKFFKSLEIAKKQDFFNSGEE